MPKHIKNETLVALVKDKKIPILTLDSKWHDLFTTQGKPYSVKQQEKHVNNLLKEQGKKVNDIKDLKHLKKNLLNEIVEQIPDGINHGISSKTMDKNKKLIEEINKKIDHQSDILADLPYQIKLANEKLMVESIKICYQNLEENGKRIKEISDWIEDIRIKLKENIIKKQILEEKSNEVYSYMHDIFGPEVIEIFDNHIKKDG